MTGDFFDNNKMDQDKLLEALHENDKVEEDKVEEKTSEEPMKLKVGEEEYTPEELSKLVELGKIGRQAEVEFKTDLKSVWPEYSKTKNREKELEDELSRIRSSVTGQDKDQITPEDRAEALKLARDMGILTKDDLKEAGYMTTEQFREQYILEKETEALIAKGDKLEGEINGKDGRPAFKKNEIFQYMVDNGVKSPETAYKLRYENELNAWSQEELKKSKKPGLVTETGDNGFKAPVEVKPTRGNLHSLISESLGQGSDE